MSNAHKVHVLREVVTKVTQMLVSREITVTQRGVTAYVKSDSRGRPFQVNIPALPDNASDDLIDAIQGFVNHEVGHVLDTDFATMSEAKLTDRQHGFWNSIEDTFVERMMERRFPGAKGNLDRTRRFFVDKITRPNIEKAKNDQGVVGAMVVPIFRQLSGQEIFNDIVAEICSSNEKVRQFYDRMKPFEAKLKELESTEECLDLMRDVESALYPPAPPPPPSSSASKPKAEKEEKEKSDTPEDEGDGESEAEPDADDKGDADEEPGKGSPEKSENNDEGESEKPASEEGDEDDDEGDEDDDEGDEDEANEGAGEDDEADEGDTSDAVDDDAGGDDADGAHGDADDDEGDEERAAASPSAEDDDGSEGEGALSGEAAEQPEGEIEMETGAHDPVDFEGEIEDFDQGVANVISRQTIEEAKDTPYLVYTRDFDEKGKLKVDSDFDPNGNIVRALDDSTSHMVGRMQKDIERMVASRSQVLQVPGFRSGRLHTSNLHRIMAGDDRLFRRKHEHKSKETAVVLLVDNSGSMNGSKLKVAMSAAYAFANTLEKVGVSNAVVGFTTKSSWGGPGSTWVDDARAEQAKTGVRFARAEDLYMPTYKDFEERVTPTVRRRFALGANGHVRMASNVDGEALLYAAELLEKRNEKRKILIVFSDGQPAGSTLSGDYNIFQKHLKQVVKDMPKRGVETLGIGIMDDAVRHYYPRNVVLRDLEKLPELVMGEIKRIMLESL